MPRLSPVLHAKPDNGLAYYCPGCGHAHVIYYGEGQVARPRWTWSPA